MDFRFIFIFICYVVVSSLGYAQTHQVNITESQDMKPFNIEVFNRNKTGNEWSYTLPSGELVRTVESDDGYVEEIRSASSPFSQTNVYYKNGHLKIRASHFYRVTTGIWKYYDINGNVTEEVNHEQGFDLGVEDIARIMLDQFHIDIMDSQLVMGFNRYVDKQNTGLPLYEVVMSGIQGSTPGNAFIISGKDGGVLFVTTRLMGDRSRGTLYEEFIKSRQSNESK